MKSSQEAPTINAGLIIYEFAGTILSAFGLFSIFYYYGIIKTSISPNDFRESIIFSIFLLKFILHFIQIWSHIPTNCAVRLCQNNTSSKLYQLAKWILNLNPNLIRKNFENSTFVKACNVSIIITIILEMILLHEIYVIDGSTDNITYIYVSEGFVIGYLTEVIIYRIIKGNQFFNVFLILDQEQNEENMSMTKSLLQHEVKVYDSVQEVIMEDEEVKHNDNDDDDDDDTFFEKLIDNAKTEILEVLTDTAEVMDDLVAAKVKLHRKMHDIFGQELIRDDIAEDVVPKSGYNNWSLCVNFKPKGIKFVKTVNDIINTIKLAKLENAKVRAVCYGHSFSPIHGDENCYILCMLPEQLTTNIHHDIEEDFEFIVNKELTRVCIKNYPLMFCELDINKNTITVGGSTPIYLYYYLTHKRLELELNVPCEPCNVMSFHQTFVGTVSVSSHGSGIYTKPMCDYVIQIKFINSFGKIITINDKKIINKIACNLGMLGIIIELTLQYEPTYFSEFSLNFIEIDQLFPINKKNNINNIGYSTKYFRNAICNDNVFYNQFMFWPTTNEVIVTSQIKTYNKKNWQFYPDKEYKKQLLIFMNKVFGLVRSFVPDLLDDGTNKASKYMTKLMSFMLHSMFKKMMQSQTQENDEKDDDDDNLNLIKIPATDGIHPIWGIYSHRVLNVELLVPLQNEENSSEKPNIELAAILFKSTMDFYNKCIKEEDHYPCMVIEMRIIKTSDVLLSPINFNNKYNYCCSIETAASLWDKQYIDNYLKWTKLLTKKLTNIVYQYYPNNNNNNDILVRPPWPKNWQHLHPNDLFNDKHKNINKFGNDMTIFFANVIGKDKINQFNEIRKIHDPTKMFVNHHLSKIFD